MKLTKKQSYGLLFAIIVIFFIRFIEKMKSFNFDALSPLGEVITIIIFEIIIHVLFILLAYWSVKKIFFR